MSNDKPKKRNHGARDMIARMTDDVAAYALAAEIDTLTDRLEALEALPKDPLSAQIISEGEVCTVILRKGGHTFTMSANYVGADYPQWVTAARTIELPADTFELIAREYSPDGEHATDLRIGSAILIRAPKKGDR